MKSKTSSSSFSMALICENLKRFWLGSLFALIGYVMVCFMPVVLNRSNPELIEVIFSGTYWPVGGLVMIIPIVAATLIYRFLQTTSSSSIVHALPLSRRMIFNSSYVSGLILCLVPIVITAIMFIAFSVVASPELKSTFDPQLGFIKVNVMSVSIILLWMIKICLLTAAAFTMSVLAAMLTGSSMAQFVLSGVIILLVPGTASILCSTAPIFVYGYVTPDFIETLMRMSSPAIAAIDPNWLNIICQVVIAVILLILAWIAYKKRDIEKASDTLIFGFTKPIVKYYLTFMGMCGCGLIAYSVQGSNGIGVFVIGAIIGAFGIYLGMDIAINKNIRAKRIALGFARYAVAVILVAIIVMLDVTGYESKIPDAEDIKGVSIFGLTAYEYDNYNYEEGGEQNLIKDADAIKSIQQLHGYIVDKKDNYFKNSIGNLFSSEYDNDESGTITIDYVLKNGSVVKRSYEVSKEIYSDNDSYKSIVENWDYKKSIYPIDKCKGESVEIKSITAEASYEGSIFGKGSIIIAEEDYSRIIDAFEADLKSLDHLHMNGIGSGTNNQFTMSVTVSRDAGISPELNEEYYKTYGYYYSEPTIAYVFNVNDGYENTIAILKELGLYDSLVINPEDVGYATVSRQQNVIGYDVAQPEIQYGNDTIIDSAQIKEIMEKGVSEITAEENGYYYEVKLYPINSNSTDDEGIYRYYDEDNAPEFIKSLF